jgi:hypothetical protein
MSNTTAAQTFAQQWCTAAENVPFKEQREVISYEFYVLISFFALAFFAVCCLSVTCSRAPPDASVQNSPSFPFKLWFLRLFILFSLIGCAAGVFTWMCEMWALEHNVDFYYFKSLTNQTSTDALHNAAHSLSLALEWSAYFDYAYSVEFFFQTLGKMMAFQVVDSQIRIHSDRLHRSGWRSEFYKGNRVPISIGFLLLILANICGTVYRVLAAEQALMASQSVSLSLEPQFTAAFDLSRKYASNQLIFECVSIAIVVICVIFQLFQTRQAEHPCLLKVKNTLSEKVAVAVTIVFVFRFIFAVLYTLAYEAYISDDCSDPCGACQSPFALLWSWSVFSPHLNVSVVLITEPIVILLVTYCVHSVMSAEGIINPPQSPRTHPPSHTPTYNTDFAITVSAPHSIYRTPPPLDSAHAISLPLLMH